jgi:MipA family protein
VGWRAIGHVAAVLGLLCCMDVAFAEDDGCAASSGAAPSDDCVAVGRWNLSVALGAGIRTNPVVHSKDIPLVVVPQFSYYGKRFFIDNLDPGVTLFEGDKNTLSLIASPGYDRVFFYRSDLQNFFIEGATSITGGGQSAYLTPGQKSGGNTGQTVRQIPEPPRKITYLAGPEWTFKYAGVSGQVDYLHEITGRNHGDEIRGALGIPLGRLGGTWTANVGITWKSAGIVNYYYGVPDLYNAGSVLNPFAKIGYSRPLSGKWKLEAFVHCERLGNAIADSPIIRSHYVTTAFVGATYVIHK